MEMEARNIYGISAATATIGHGIPLWTGLRQYLLRLIYDWFLVSGLDVTGVTEHEQEAQLMLTNPRDAFSSQSRSPNLVPFHMLDC